MGKIKERLIEDMIKHPELYNGKADYEFWVQCRKEELFKKREVNNKISQTKRKKR